MPVVAERFVLISNPKPFLPTVVNDNCEVNIVKIVKSLLRSVYVIFTACGCMILKSGCMILSPDLYKNSVVLSKNILKSCYRKIYV